MKKLALAAFSALAFGAFAAPQRLGLLQIADADGLVAGVAKLGEMMGNPMVSSMVAPTIAQNPVTKLFGPARAGAGVTAVVFAEGEALEKDPEALLESVWPVVFYPVTETKAQFLARQSGAIETNGVVTVVSPETVLAWTDDGKWVVASDSAEHVKAGLAEVSVAQRPLGADLARVEGFEPILAKAPGFLDKVIELAEMDAAEREKTKASVAELRKLMEGIVHVSVATRLSEKGWDFEGTCTCKPGSAGDRFGSAGSVGPDALAFAGKDAFIAVAAAARARLGSLSDLSVFADVIRKHGLKLDFITSETAGDVTKVVVDFPAAFAYFTGEEGSAAFEKIDPQAFLKDIDAASNLVKTELREKPESVSVALKGLASDKTPAARFAAALPEAASVAPYSVSIVSYYSFLKELAAQVVKVLPSELQGQVSPLLKTLPSDEGACCAACVYRKGATHFQLSRITKEELKGFGALFNVGMGYAMSSMMQGSGVPDDDDDDDDLDDDED